MEIRAFQGWRHRTTDGDVGALIAPPYDVLTQADKDALLASNPANIVAVDLPHWPPKEAAPDDVYAQAARTLLTWQADGRLARDEKPCLYAYQQTYTWAGRTYTRRTMLAAVRLTAFGEGIWPHEHTFAGPKADRLKLSEATGMQISPIFGFFDDSQRATDALYAAATGAPDAAGDLGGVREELWAVSDPEVIAAVTAAASGQDLFIADGHHRYTTALNYRDGLGEMPADHPANFIMFAMVAVDDPGLIVLPTHRVIRGLKGFDLAALIDATRGVMEWTDAAPAEADLLDAGAWLSGFGVHAMAFAAGDRVAVGRLTDPAAMQRVAADEIPAWRELDVAILHRLVIDDVLGAGDAAIDYLADGAAALAEARDGSADLVVLMQGTPLAAVSEIALAGCVMPHKSTYFYPKLATGMVLHPLK